MTDPIEAVADAIDDEFNKNPDDEPSSYQLARAAIQAYQQAVASEAVGIQHRYKLADGSWTRWYTDGHLQLNGLPSETRNIFAPPAIPAGWKLVRETTAERYGIKTQADLDAFFAKVDAMIAAAPTPEAENE